MNIIVIIWRPGLVFRHLITAEIFRDQRWLISSRTQQKSWCTNRGIQEGHIPFPKRKLQPVCYWQPKDYRNLPKMKKRAVKNITTCVLCYFTRNWRLQQMDGLNCSHNNYV